MNFNYLKEAVGAIFSDYLPTDEQINQLKESIEVAVEYTEPVMINRKEDNNIQFEVSVCCNRPVIPKTYADFGGVTYKHFCQCCNKETRTIAKTFLEVN